MADYLQELAISRRAWVQWDMSVIQVTRGTDAGGLQTQGQLGSLVRPCLTIKFIKGLGILFRCRSAVECS